MINRHWVICKTRNGFSAMPVDQAHKQNNELVKGTGGAVGLTENSSAFRRWMLAGPEQAQLIREFEVQYKSEVSGKYAHYEEGFLLRMHSINKFLLWHRKSRKWEIHF